MIITDSRPSGFPVERGFREENTRHSKTPCAPWEIKAWSAFAEERGPDSVRKPSRSADFLGKFFKTREDVKTWFEAIELDDHVSYQFSQIIGTMSQGVAFA